MRLAQFHRELIKSEDFALLLPKLQHLILKATDSDICVLPEFASFSHKKAKELMLLPNYDESFLLICFEYLKLYAKFAFNDTGIRLKLLYPATRLLFHGKYLHGINSFEHLSELDTFESLRPWISLVRSVDKESLHHLNKEMFRKLILPSLCWIADKSALLYSACKQLLAETRDEYSWLIQWLIRISCDDKPRNDMWQFKWPALRRQSLQALKDCCLCRIRKGKILESVMSAVAEMCISLLPETKEMFIDLTNECPVLLKYLYRHIKLVEKLRVDEKAAILDVLRSLRFHDRKIEKHISKIISIVDRMESDYQKSFAQDVCVEPMYEATWRSSFARADSRLRVSGLASKHETYLRQSKFSEVDETCEEIEPGVHPLLRKQLDTKQVPTSHLKQLSDLAWKLDKRFCDRSIGGIEQEITKLARMYIRIQ